MYNKVKGLIEDHSGLYVALGLVVGILLVEMARSWLGHLGVILVGGVAILLLLLIWPRTRK